MLTTLNSGRRDVIFAQFWSRIVLDSTTALQTYNTASNTARLELFQNSLLQFWLADNESFTRHCHSISVLFSWLHTAEKPWKETPHRKALFRAECPWFPRTKYLWASLFNTPSIYVFSLHHCVTGLGRVRITWLRLNITHESMRSGCSHHRRLVCNIKL